MASEPPEKRSRIITGSEVDSEVAAKVQLSKFVGNCIVQFKPDVSRRETCLFELNNGDLEKYILGGNPILVKGSDQDAVLCTTSSTFSLKRVETSNDIYCVAPSSSSTFDILFKCKDFFEVSPIKGRVNKLLDYMRDTKYTGRASEKSIDKSKLLTRAQIDSIIEASEAEISACLLEFNVVEMNGFMRLLDPATLDESMESLIQAITLNGLSLGGISEAVLIDLMPDFEPVFIKYSLTKIGSSTEAARGGLTWVLDWESICRKTARFVMNKMVAQGGSQLVKADEFLDQWALNTPGKDAPREKLLEGLAIREEVSTGGKQSAVYFRYLPLDSLPLDAKSRFEKLFQARNRYSIEELEPYTRDLYGGVSQPKTLAELLVQSTKIIDKYYYSK